MNNWDLYKYVHSNGGSNTVVKDTRFKELVERTLTSVDDSEITLIGTNAFSSGSLRTINLPSVKSLSNYAFNSNVSLSTVNLPIAKTFGNYAFAWCTSLAELSLPSAVSFGSYAFRSCSVLKTLILGADTVCTLADNTAFNDTPIATGTGYIYVPSALIEDYKTATNWVTFADQFRAIEDYPEITGG